MLRNVLHEMLTKYFMNFYSFRFFCELHRVIYRKRVEVTEDCYIPGVDTSPQLSRFLDRRDKFSIRKAWAVRMLIISKFGFCKVRFSRLPLVVGD